MNINKQVFKKVASKNAKILVVTKYWNKKITEDLIKECEEDFSKIFFGIGENRVKILEEKKILREKVHFIGNLQSKKLKKIVKYCSTIHSLSSIKHAEKLNKISNENNLKLKVFIQIKLDKNKPNGILPEELKTFLEKMKKFENIQILGISGMGMAIDNQQLTINNKKIEFKLLIKLRDKYLPRKLISAGTSQDYEIALEEGISVVRIGRKII